MSRNVGDERLRRLGRMAYEDIGSTKKAAPIPNKMKHRPYKVVTYAGLEFAREPLSAREFNDTVAARSRVKTLQHIVDSKDLDVAEKGFLSAPWLYRVRARCKAKLRRAAVKVERQFLDLEICPKCWKTVAPPK